MLRPVGSVLITSESMPSADGRALHVHDRRFAGHSDCLLEGADAQPASTDAVNAPVRLMPSRLTVLKPGSVNVTTYAGPQLGDATT